MPRREVEPLRRRAYTVADVAGVLGVSEKHIRNKISDGTISIVRLGGRVLIPVDVVERLLRALDAPTNPYIEIPDWSSVFVRDVDRSGLNQ